MTRQPHLVTFTEAARKLSVPIGTLYSWSSRGWITPYAIGPGGTKLFVLSELQTIQATTRPRKARHA